MRQPESNANSAFVAPHYAHHMSSINNTGLLGVAHDTSGWHTRTPYKVQIRNHGKQRTIGRYATKDEAGDAYYCANAVRREAANRHVL